MPRWMTLAHQAGDWLPSMDSGCTYSNGAPLQPTPRILAGPWPPPQGNPFGAPPPTHVGALPPSMVITLVCVVPGEWPGSGSEHPPPPSAGQPVVCSPAISGGDCVGTPPHPSHFPSLCESFRILFVVISTTHKKRCEENGSYEKNYTLTLFSTLLF